MRVVTCLDGSASWHGDPRSNWGRSTMAKILIVDDSVFTRNLLRRVFESGGHTVVGHAGNGEQAMTLFKTLHPELVTLDYLMPNKNGESVLEEMIQHDPNAKVIMISGSGDNTVEERVLQTGAKDYVEKLHVQREILEVIDQVMEA
jgi:two-component system chemotaxis response regulator CheY